MHKQIFKNTTFQLVARIMTTGIGFLLTILIARSFGVSTFGEFSKITSFVALFYLFVDFGINAIFLKNPKSYSSFFYLRIGLSLLVFLIANLIAITLPYNPVTQIGFSPGARLGIFIFSFTIFAQAISFSTSAVFQKNFRYDLYMISQVAGSLFNLFLIALLVFFVKSITFVIFSYVLANFITSIVSIFFVKENIKEMDIPYSKEIFSQSIPIGLMLIFNLIYFRIDIFLLSLMKSNASVGTYSLAYRFFDFFIAIPLFISNSIYPKLLDSLNKKEEFLKITKNYLFIYFFISILIIVPVWFLSPLLGLIGSQYLQSITPLRILIISLPLFFLTSFIQWILISLNRQRFLMVSYFFCAILNVILNIIFIPRFSYIGSAVITVIGEALVFLILIIKLKKIKII